MSTRAISLNLQTNHIRYHHCNGYDEPDFNAGEDYTPDFPVENLTDYVLERAAHSDWEFIWLKDLLGMVYFSQKKSAAQYPDNVLQYGWLGSVTNSLTGEYFYWTDWEPMYEK